MKSGEFVKIQSKLILLSALFLLVALPCAQAAEKIIHAFAQSDGSSPLGGLISDEAGNLYGTTSLGGLKSCSYSCGTVFELSPGSGGVWTETVLYYFASNITGMYPYGTLTRDKQGNLYGVAQNGQLSATGVVFELSKGSNSEWSEKVIHNFPYTEGAPKSDLTLDNNGNLYGIAPNGGSSSQGELFELSPQSDGSWKETIAFSFSTSVGIAGPVAGVSFDSKGNLYGAGGGGTGKGVIYELSPQGNGQWTGTVLYTFSSFAAYLNSKLTLDASGNLYGTTETANTGAVFEVSPGSSGAWTETTLYTFKGKNDGDRSQGTLAFDSEGNLYGTTYDGGPGCNGYTCGVAYRLSPQSDGAWKETIIHPFESANDGSQPQYGVFFDGAGHLYGTTEYGGGRYGYGTVFEISQ